MLSGNCTEALSVQAHVTIASSSAKFMNNGSAPLRFPLPALLKQYWYSKRGEKVRVRGHAPFYATLGSVHGRPPRPCSRALGPRTCGSRGSVFDCASPLALSVGSPA